MAKGDRRRANKKRNKPVVRQKTVKGKRKNPTFSQFGSPSQFAEMIGGMAGDLAIREACKGCTLPEKMFVASMITSIVMPMIRLARKAEKDAGERPQTPDVPLDAVSPTKEDHDHET